MPQEGTVVNSSRRESLPGVTLTPPLLQVKSVLLPARANSVAAPVAPTPPLPSGGFLGLQPRDKAAMLGVKTKEYFLEEFT